jgi:hypothetical protein
MTNLYYVGPFLNPYLLGEDCLHNDANAKEALNKILRKTVCMPSAYALVLKSFTNFVES